MRLYCLAVDKREPELLLCACGATYDAGDNYCRRCGLPLRADVPSVREQFPATVWQPPVPPAMLKAAGVLAAGTLAEYMMRRLVRRALAPVRALVPGRPQPALRAGGPPTPTDVFQETVIVRRLRIRGR